MNSGWMAVATPPRIQMIHDLLASMGVEEHDPKVSPWTSPLSQRSPPSHPGRPCSSGTELRTDPRRVSLAALPPASQRMRPTLSR